MASEHRPCADCPWVSGQPRDREATTQPSVEQAMKRGDWFCCHVNMGTCYGAKLRYEQHQKKVEAHAH